MLEHASSTAIWIEYISFAEKPELLARFMTKSLISERLLYSPGNIWFTMIPIQHKSDLMNRL
jgi:hypothetical protein